MRKTRFVIAGGGVAALEALLAIQSDARDLIDVTVVADTDVFAYRSLQIGEAFGGGAPRRYSLPLLVANLGATFQRGSIAAVRIDARELLLDSGAPLSYDALMIALGARSIPGYDHGTTFAPGAFEEVLDDLHTNFADDVTIVVPPAVTWSLPAYELALMTAAADPNVRVRLVTHEAAPLEIFGAQAAAVVADVLARAAVELVVGVQADVPGDGVVRAGGLLISTARVVSLPVPVGPRLRGLPCSNDGYLSCDQHGRVRSAPAVWAAGDGTTQPIKQGGLASQQADAAAADIARHAGAGTRPRPFRPVLRGLLRTIEGPLYLRRPLTVDDDAPTVSREPLWWPPSKVASRRLAGHLARIDIALDSGTRLSDGGFALSALR
jgi:sulfide:quinone oxidoreductase